MEFIDFKRAVYKQFDALANNADRLYLTNVNKDELWDCYIGSYPEDERQSHTCNCCRQFIKPYGNVVAIVNNKLVSIWDSLVLDEPYATVARNLAQLVKSKPVENVIWEDEPRMEGMYTVYVHNFCKRDYHDVGFTVEIECNGEVREYTYTTDLRGHDKVTVARFEYSKAKGIVIHDVLPSNSSDKETWNLSTNKFHKVSLLTLSPNYWNGAEVGNKHYFFILDGCKNPSPVRGFFNEYLRSELSQDRKTFEMLANKMKAPYSDNQLSGLGFSSTIRNSVICKVTGSFTRTIKVNF